MKLTVILALMICASSSALAKGGMWLEGTISDVKAESDVLSFTVKGDAGFGWTTNVVWHGQQIHVRTPRWTSKYDAHTPATDPYAVTFTNAVFFATRRAGDSRKTSVEFLEPTVSFGIEGNILRIEAKDVFVRPLKEELPLPKQ